MPFNTPLLPAVLIIESLVGVSHASTLNKLFPIAKASMTLEKPDFKILFLLKFITTVSAIYCTAINTLHKQEKH